MLLKGVLLYWLSLRASDLCINNEIRTSEEESKPLWEERGYGSVKIMHVIYIHRVSKSEATVVRHGRAECIVLQQQFKAGRVLCLVISGFSSPCCQAWTLLSLDISCHWSCAAGSCQAFQSF